MSAVQVLVFDRNQAFLGQIEPYVVDVSWRLNNVGRAMFVMPYADPKCIRTYLQYGNRVLVRFDNGLPDFGGVLDPPRKRDSTSVMVAAYTAERIFSWRVTAKSRRFTTTAPGTIYQTLIEEENAQRQTGIAIGAIYVGGTARTIDYHYHDFLKRCQDLAKLTGQDFDVSSEYADGAVTFKANWYEVRGADKSGAVFLLEGDNVMDVRLDEQGEIANTVYLAGLGQTWGTSRYIAFSTDETSEADYGFREYAEVQSGVVMSDTLDKNADEVLAIKKDAKKRFTLVVADKAPGLFAEYGVGDRVTLQAFLKGGSDWMFDGTVRIRARQWRADNTCRLEVEAED